MSATISEGVRQQARRSSRAPRTRPLTLAFVLTLAFATLGITVLATTLSGCIIARKYLPDIPAPGADGPVIPGHSGAQTPPAVQPFDCVQITADGTVYVGMPPSVSFEMLQPQGDASLYWLDIPGTVAVKAADFFALYSGKLYFTEFIHPTDAAARKTALYVANADGSNVQVFVSDVAAETRPCIIDGVLYYQSHDFYDGAKVYTRAGANGAPIEEVGFDECTTVLRACNLTTGEVNTHPISEGITGSFIGASAKRLFVVESYGDDTQCASLALDFSDRRPFTLRGWPSGVDEAGHVVSSVWAHDGYIFHVSDETGAVLASIATSGFGGIFVQNRYLMYHDAHDVLHVFDTVALAEIACMPLLDNFAENEHYFMYDVRTGVAYFLGEHGLVAGPYKTWGSDERSLSVFSVDAAGQVRRVVPTSADMWRRTGADYMSPRAYALQWSEIDFYTHDQLSTLSDEELFYGRNEIFWVHGYEFVDKAADADLQAFFAAKTWPRELVGQPLTAAERENLALIEQIEAERKSSYVQRGWTSALLK